MLSPEQNLQLTQVGPGTPMGEVMRRHWHPVAGIDELDRHPVKAVRLLGEDLVLYRDLSGNYGLMERHCAHRRADLSHGFVEREGLRCNYHGWQYDARGQGSVTDRTRENLAASDRGVTMIRRQYFKDIDAVAQGRDPKGVFRDPAAAQRVALPCGDWRDFLERSLPRDEYARHPKWSKLLHHFVFHPGQPDWVRQACEAATGVAMRDVDVVDV